ncbi:hypothetical protein [Variovorax sp. GB1P17]|uniref:hypothetical protein n=1 Tax=Variovorax sp. GB1P17 TaxID=3443740 RepID=UPI003F46E0B1
MPRTKGAKNIVAFEDRPAISTSPNSDIKHLARTATRTELESFLALLRHQTNFTNWIISRHEELQKLRIKKGPKDATYNKYKWYAEHLLLLEAINAFEVFYKRSIVAVGTALAPHVPADRVKGNIDTRILWTAPPGTPAPDLIFESKLYHDLDEVDKATDALVQAKRYNKNSPSAALRQRVRTLQAVFQLRHTLSHNHGLVTASDAGKLQLLGYSAKVGEVIDPTKDYLATAVRRTLESEAKDFSKWLLSATANYLQNVHTSTGAVLFKNALNILEARLGKHASLSALPWIPSAVL